MGWGKRVYPFLDLGFLSYVHLVPKEPILRIV
jgi:hypothetical protein